MNFCFLGGVPKQGGKIETQWCNFLENIPKKRYKYRLITHPAKYNDENHKKSRLNQTGLKIIPRKYWTPTKWGTKSLILGTLKMFSYAYSLNKEGEKGENNYYILVDSTCFPITKDKNDIEERMKLLFNGNENISNGDQWISITEGFLKSILKSCYTCGDDWKIMQKRYWPDGIEYDPDNENLIYNDQNCKLINEFKDMCKKTHKFIYMFLETEYNKFQEVVHGKTQDIPKEIKDFGYTLDDTMVHKIKSNLKGGVWDENFFTILSIIWKRVRNRMSSTQISKTKLGIDNLLRDDNYKFTNRIFVNPQSPFKGNIISFKGKEGLKQKKKFLEYSKDYVGTKPKIMSHVFTNWTVFSNANQNMLRFDVDIKNFNKKIKEYYDEVLITSSKYTTPVQYIQFIEKIYNTNGKKQPFYHPIEIYVNKTTAIDSRSKHCKDEGGEYDKCLEHLQMINELTIKSLQIEYNNNKKYDYDDFVNKMIETIYQEYDRYNEFVTWARAYLYMFEPDYTPPNLYDDKILLGIAEQYKHCLFTRKIID